MIPAGGRGEIEVTLKTGLSAHRLSKSIYVYCNDPSQNIVILTISADVQKDASMPAVKRNEGDSRAGKIPADGSENILDLLNMRP